MVNDATRKYRDLIAFGLLAVAALYFIGALSVLFNTDTGFDFADKASVSVFLFASLMPILSLVVAALLVTQYGEPSSSSRIVVLIALAIAALELLFTAITFFAQLGSNLPDGPLGGPSGGKAIAIVFGLAHLLLLALAGLYLYTALRSLPSPARARQPAWGYGQPGYGPGQPGYGPGQPGYGPGQPAWGSPAPSAPAGQQSWWQPPGSSYGWGAGSPGQPGGWSQQGAAPQASPPPHQGGWSDPAVGWHDPAAAQQGQPASSWTQSGQGWSPPEAPSTNEWDQSGENSWAQPSGASEWTPEPADPPAPAAEPAAGAGGAQPGVVVDAGDGEQQPGTSEDGSADDAVAASEPPADEPPTESGGWWSRREK